MTEPPALSILRGIDPARQPSFTLGNRLGRAVWGVVWTLLGRTSPRPCHKWRALLLRCFGARLGRNVHIYPGVRIWAPWNLDIGDDVGVGDGANLYSMAPIRIGTRAVVSQGAHLCTGTHDFEDASFQLLARPIRIGSFAWVCAETFIGPGVEIHEGAVLGARAVTFRDIPAWTVAAGNPAKAVKHRHWRPKVDP